MTTSNSRRDGRGGEDDVAFGGRVSSNASTGSVFRLQGWRICPSWDPVVSVFFGATSAVLEGTSLRDR